METDALLYLAVHSRLDADESQDMLDKMRLTTSQFTTEASDDATAHVSLAPRFDRFLIQITYLIDGVVRDFQGSGELGLGWMPWGGRSTPRFCTKELSQTPHGTSQRDHGCIAFRELVEVCHDAAVLFQPAKHALDHVALSVLRPVEQSCKTGLGLRFIERSGMTDCIRYWSQ
jgi:hypothetical protein